MIKTKTITITTTPMDIKKRILEIRKIKHKIEMEVYGDWHLRPREREEHSRLEREEKSLFDDLLDMIVEEE